MEKASHQVLNLRWWNLPIPLLSKSDRSWTQLGWVWNSKVYAVRNITHGWIAFVEDQTEENLTRQQCKRCGELHVNAESNLLSEWLAKTDWLQQEFSEGKFQGMYSPLGLHRADFLRQYVENLRARIVALEAKNER